MIPIANLLPSRLRHAAMALLACVAMPAQAQYHAYVGNYGNGTVSVVNTSTQSVIATIPLPGAVGPLGTAVNNANTRAYVANHGNATLSVIDIAAGTASAAVPVPGGAATAGVAVSPDGTRVYVSGISSDTVAVFNTSPGSSSVTHVATVAGFDGPHLMAVSPDGSRLYVADFNNQRVAVMNTSSFAITGIPLPGRTPLGLALSNDGSLLYVGHQMSHGVTPISNPASGSPTVGATIPTGGTCPNGLVFSRDQGSVFVTHECSASVTRIDVATGVAAPVVATGGAPRGISITPDGTKVFLASGGANAVFAYNPSLALLAPTVAVGPNPYGSGGFIARPYSYNGAVVDVTALRGLVIAAALPDTRLNNTLLAPLNAALNWLNGNDANRVVNACSNLAKFISVVRQNIQNGKLAAGTGNPWVSDANSILSQLGCPTR